MPLPGGPSSKLGNRYERWWTVYQLVRIINRHAENIRIEDLTVDKAEFVITAGDHQELHQAKTQSFKRQVDSNHPWELSFINCYRRYSSSFIEPPIRDLFLSQAVTLQS